MEMGTHDSGSMRAALQPAALREALVPHRPVFANPWDSTADMFACYVAVCVVIPGLLWAGGRLMGDIFGFDPNWELGVYMVAALVGAAGFMTIVGRERTRLAVDFLAVAIWVLLGFVVAPILGLALPTIAALICYAILLAITFGYVVFIGHFERAFLRSISWPITWSLIALLFAYLAYRLIYFQ